MIKETLRVKNKEVSSGNNKILFYFSDSCNNYISSETFRFKMKKYTKK